MAMVAIAQQLDEVGEVRLLRDKALKASTAHPTL